MSKVVDQLLAEQPAPTASAAPPVLEDLRIAAGVPRIPLLALLEEAVERRAAQGLAHYGDHLRPFNGRDAEADAFQELLDALFYLSQRVIETGDRELSPVVTLTTEALLLLLIRRERSHDDAT